jgi:5-methylcytosine-specific restriction endonuclease McrA
MEIISRKEAKAVGLTHYFTGKPCSRKHLSRRFVSSYLCETCNVLRQRIFYSENTPSILERTRKYYQQNTAWYKRKSKIWRDNNPEKRRKYHHDYRAKKRNASGQFTVEGLRLKYAFQGECCYYCKRKVRWKEKHIDHKIPLIYGGTNWLSNIAISCASCNLRKNKKTVREFLKTNEH